MKNICVVSPQNLYRSVSFAWQWVDLYGFVDTALHIHLNWYFSRCFMSAVNTADAILQPHYRRQVYLPTLCCRSVELPPWTSHINTGPIISQQCHAKSFHNTLAYTQSKANICLDNLLSNLVAYCSRQRVWANDKRGEEMFRAKNNILQSVISLWCVATQSSRAVCMTWL